jgi:hypothetical protein
VWHITKKDFSEDWWSESSSFEEEDRYIAMAKAVVFIIITSRCAFGDVIDRAPVENAKINNNNNCPVAILLRTI